MVALSPRPAPEGHRAVCTAETQRAERLNSRPRKRLGYRTPREC